MAQFGLPVINPSVKDGEGLAYDLNAWAQAIHSGHSGGSRPSYITGGMTWVKNSSNPWQMYIFDGTDDVLTGTLDITTNTYTPVGGGGGGTGVPGYVTDLPYSYTYGLGSISTSNLLKITGGITAAKNSAKATDGEGVGVFVKDLRASTVAGTVGNVNGTLFSHTVTRNGLQNSYEWNGVFILDMLSSGPGEHCASYSQANAYGTSATWGAVNQVDDMRYDQSDNGLLWGLEVDCFVSGSGKTNSAGIVVVANDSKKVFTGTASATTSLITYGIRLATENGAKFKTGFEGTAYVTEGLKLYDYAGVAESNITLQGSHTRAAITSRFNTAPYGIDFTEGNTFSTAAIGLAGTHTIKFGSNTLGASGTDLMWNGVPVGGGGGSGSSIVTPGSIAQFGSYLSDPGHALLTIPTNKRLVFNKQAGGSDPKGIYIIKDLTSVTGGGGTVNSVFSVETTMGSGYAGREHVQEVTLINNAIVTAGSVGVGTSYSLVKNSTSAVIATVSTVTDNTNIANQDNLIAGHMINLYSGGGDGYLARNGIIISANKNAAGATTYSGRGIYIYAGANAGYSKGVEVSGAVVDAGYLFSGSVHSAATETAVFRSTGTAHKGINLRSSSHSTGLAVDIAQNDSYAVNGVPVLKRQAGGWGKVLNVNTSYRNYSNGDLNLDNITTSLVTLDASNHQSHLIALYKVLFTLINDLRFHGIIGGNPNSTANPSYSNPPT